MAAAKVTIKEDRRAYDKLVKAVVGLDRPIAIDFGVFGAKSGSDMRGLLSMVEIAAVHEFGAPSAGIPSRSFLRAYVEENESKLRAFLAKLLEAVLEGKYKRDQAFNLFALRVVGEMKKRISDGLEPQVAPATQKRKGESKTKPLINTGQLRNSITYRISDGGDEIAFPDTEHGVEQKKIAKAKKVAEAKEERAKVRAVNRAARKAQADKKRARKKAIKSAKKAVTKTVKNARKSIKKGIKQRVRDVKKVLKASKTVKRANASIKKSRKRNGS